MTCTEWRLRESLRFNCRPTCISIMQVGKCWDAGRRSQFGLSCKCSNSLTVGQAIGYRRLLFRACGPRKATPKSHGPRENARRADAFSTLPCHGPALQLVGEKAHPLTLDIYRLTASFP